MLFIEVEKLEILGGHIEIMRFIEVEILELIDDIEICVS